ncbi:hypothetical protein DdX_18420 [Ditylenchus destructor]|uniref:Uncharacterized protein n=1 Tax=Ditylenchus destructor TaxID=166010 RepID=A0AAD4MKW0_9BILA|nr:hypothetical protein DdX_18420 [Ditylenchus destructor]
MIIFLLLLALINISHHSFAEKPFTYDEVMSRIQAINDVVSKFASDSNSSGIDIETFYQDDAQYVQSLTTIMAKLDGIEQSLKDGIIPSLILPVHPGQIPRRADRLKAAISCYCSLVYPAKLGWKSHAVYSIQWSEVKNDTCTYIKEIFADVGLRKSDSWSFGRDELEYDQLEKVFKVGNRISSGLRELVKKYEGLPEEQRNSTQSLGFDLADAKLSLSKITDKIKEVGLFWDPEHFRL